MFNRPWSRRLSRTIANGSVVPKSMPVRSSTRISFIPSKPSISVLEPSVLGLFPIEPASASHPPNAQQAIALLLCIGTVGGLAGFVNHAQHGLVPARYEA